MRVIALIIGICLAHASWRPVYAAEPAEAPEKVVVAKGCRLEDPRRCLELAGEFVKKGDGISALEAFSVACAAHEAEGCQGVGPFVARLTVRGWLLGNIDEIREMTLNLTIGGEAQPANMELRVSRLWVDASRVRRLECKGFQGDYEASEVRQFTINVKESSQAPAEFRYAVITGWVPFVDKEPCLFSTDTKVRLSSTEAATLFGASRTGTYRVDSQGRLNAMVRIGSVDVRRDVAAGAAGLALVIVILLLVVWLRRRRAGPHVAGAEDPGTPPAPPE
ncbi:MAG: hypothetical protein LAN70_11735 [Acidobacteriia bacterium]|nr:hypothetical protein [Terriglobia bacterium]